MIHVFPLLATANGKNTTRIQAIRSRLPIALACFVAAVVFASVAAASSPLMSWMDGAVEGAESLTALPAPDTGVATPVAPANTARARGRSTCDSCGVVESVRRLEPAAGMPAFYEMTVRLRDGSSRVTSIANTAQWHAGDRIMLIGSAKPTLQ
jgi:hypothetical protein